MKSVRFWVILGGIVVLLSSAVGFFVWRKPEAPVVKSEAEIRSEWHEEVGMIIRDYPSKKNALQTRDALVGLRVTAADRDTHLALVLAMQAIVNGTPGADARWQAAVAQVSSTP